MTQKFTQQVGRDLVRSQRRHKNKRKFYSDIPKLKKGRRGKAWKVNVSFNFGARNKGRKYTQPLAFKCVKAPKLRLSGGDIKVTIRIHKLGVSYTYTLGDEEDRLEARAKALGQWAARQKAVKNGTHSDETNPEDADEEKQRAAREASPGSTVTHTLTPDAAQPTQSPEQVKKEAAARRMKTLKHFKKHIDKIRNSPTTSAQTHTAKVASQQLADKRPALKSHVASALGEHRAETSEAIDTIHRGLTGLHKLPSSSVVSGSANPAILKKAIGKLRQRELTSVHKAADTIAKMIDPKAVDDALGSIVKDDPQLAALGSSKLRLMAPMIAHLLENGGVEKPRHPDLPHTKYKPAPKPVAFDTEPAYLNPVKAAAANQTEDFLLRLEDAIVDLLSDIRPHDVALAEALSDTGMRTAYVMHAAQIMRDMLGD